MLRDLETRMGGFMEPHAGPFDEAVPTEANIENRKSRMPPWFLVAALGFGGMWWAFSARPRLDPRAPWGSGMLVIGPRADAKATLPG